MYIHNIGVKGALTLTFISQQFVVAAVIKRMADNSEDN